MPCETNYQTACNSSNPNGINRRQKSPVSSLEDIMSNTTDTLESEYDFSLIIINTKKITLLLFIL